MKKIEIRSQAKINIGLYVTEKRADGFHNIETVFYPVRLADLLTFTKGAELTYTTDNTELQTEPEKNLIVRAVRLLEKECNHSLPVIIEHNKVIPMGAGLGGGSSNAAITLLSVNELFSLGIPEERLRTLALQLGSDVPFFLRPNPAFATGRGEQLQEISISLDLPLLIVNPRVSVSTAMAYSKIIPKPAPADLRKLNGFTGTDYTVLKELAGNDFEQPVFSLFPEIEELKNTLYKNGAVYSLMSGSGSTVFAYFPDEDSRARAMSKLPGHYLIIAE